MHTTFTLILIFCAIMEEFGTLVKKSVKVLLSIAYFKSGQYLFQKLFWKLEY
jgi:hypothetical protein